MTYIPDPHPGDMMVPPPITRDRFEIKVDSGTNATVWLGFSGGAAGYQVRIIDRHTGRPQKCPPGMGWTLTYRGAYKQGEKIVDMLVSGKRKIK